MSTLIPTSRQQPASTTDQSHANASARQTLWPFVAAAAYTLVVLIIAVFLTFYLLPR
jgi:hypothetical protein